MRTQLARIKRKVLFSALKASDALTNSDKYWRVQEYANGYHNPEYRFNKDQIALIHLPKTGGTSFGELLATDPENRFINLEIHKQVSWYCPPTDFKYVTIMRNPIDRVWSQYQMVVRMGKKYPYNKYTKDGFESFLENCWAVQNLVVRYLCGLGYTAPDEPHLIESQKTLSCFYAILDFDNFAEEISSFLNKHNIHFDALPNVWQSKYDPPNPTEIELIRKFNSLDIALWEWWKNQASTP